MLRQIAVFITILHMISILVDGFSFRRAASEIVPHNVIGNGLYSVKRCYHNSHPSISFIASKKIVEDDKNEEKPDILAQVASKGLAGVLAIAVAEAIFWALGLPLAEIYYKYTSGEWIDLSTSEGQLQAAGFSFGYGGFATVILQYRVTLFAIPLVPIMDKFVVEPGKRIFGERFGTKEG